MSQESLYIEKICTGKEAISADDITFNRTFFLPYFVRFLNEVILSISNTLVT